MLTGGGGLVGWGQGSFLVVAAVESTVATVGSNGGKVSVIYRAL